MGTNRKIKSDGEIHIGGTNVDIESTVDVTGDVNATGDVGGATATITGNATVGGTLGVTGQATLNGIAYPTADGTADQVLTTNGSGTLSFADAASGGGGDIVVVRVTKTGDQSISTNAYTKITFDDETIDNTNAFASNRFTSKINGYYKIGGNISMFSLNSSALGSVTIYKNGSQYNTSIHYLSETKDNHTAKSGSFNDIVELDVDDYVEFYAANTNDSSYSISSISFVTIEKINADAASGGGGVDVDVIASASDATNYTGTARFINITSSANVTFTNTTITDRIIYCSNNITVKFQPESFKNNIVKMSGASSTFTIESPHDGGEAGNETNVHNCDIKCKNVLNLISGAQDPAGSGEEPLDLHITNCTINANQISLSTTATLDTDQRVYVESSNINCAIFQNTKDDDNTAFVKFGSKVVAQYVIGFFDVDNGGSIECLDGSNSQTVRIDIGSTTYLNSAYSLPFVASSNGIETSVVAIASADAGQTIPTATLTDVVYEDEEVDNTSSYDTSTGIFTAKVKGFYAIHARILFGSTGGFDSGEMVYLQVYKNSAAKITGNINEAVVTDTNTILYGSGVSGGVLLDVGDTLRARVYQSSGADDDLLNQNDDNYIQIYKVN